VVGLSHVFNEVFGPARKRWTATDEEDSKARDYAFQLVCSVRRGGGFVVREKEGNPDGH
jgi:hypothetical protein